MSVCNCVRHLRPYGGIISRSRRGFTLVELLVVIGILVVLMAILLPTLTIARESARKARCTAGLRNIGAAMTAYGADNQGQLPVHAGNGNNWLWDLTFGTRNAIMKTGAVRDSFYCPSGDLQNDDALWNFPDATTGWTVTGYYWLMHRLGGGQLSNANITFMNYPAGTPDEKRRLRKRIVSKWPAEVELVTDSNLSVGNPPRFSGIDGGWPSHRSNHLKRGNQGAGGNILFLDGHVVWRDISEMKVRFQPGHDEWF